MDSVLETILNKCRELATQLATANEQETKIIIEKLHNLDNAMYWYKKAL